jgi:hypothetical protein
MLQIELGDVALMQDGPSSRQNLAGRKPPREMVGD